MTESSEDEEYFPMSARNVVSVCLATVLVIATMSAAIVMYHWRTVETQREIGRACVAAGNVWVQNQASNYECRKA
jgi:hypothetical protein